MNCSKCGKELPDYGNYFLPVCNSCGVDERNAAKAAYEARPEIVAERAAADKVNVKPAPCKNCGAEWVWKTRRISLRNTVSGWAHGCTCHMNGEGTLSSFGYDEE